MKKLAAVLAAFVISFCALAVVSAGLPKRAPAAQTSTTSIPTTPDTLSTPVPDPRHPESPWTVTSHQLAAESLELFINRHFLRVEAVRKFLNKP